MDNSSSILGTLYFWEHYASNSTHVLEDYEGGYAAYNFSGGLPAVSPPEISGEGAPTKIPERYIPVGQGFFVGASSTGGNVLFENDQRVFVKEMVTGPADNGSVFFRNSNYSNMPTNEDLEAIKRLRLNFTTPEGAVRPLLLAFVPNGLATDGFDYGYDGINTETLPNDMSWDIDGENYIIQGVGDYDETHFFPVTIDLSTTGTIEVELAGIENFEETITVYVYDSLLNTYTQINDFNYQETLDSGSYSNRFYITFTENSTLSTVDTVMDSLVVKYLNTPETIYINTPHTYLIEKVSLINMLGQVVQTWNVENVNQNSALRIPVKHLAEGNYIVQVSHTHGTVSKKVVVAKR